MKLIADFLHNVKCFTFWSLALIGFSWVSLQTFSLLDDDYVLKFSIRPFGFAFINQTHFEDEMRARLKFEEVKKPKSK